MKRRMTFQAATQPEAEALAANWIKSHPGCRVIDSRAMQVSVGAMRTGTPLAGGTWTVVLEYEDEPKPN
jgi:hypothetical protein